MVKDTKLKRTSERRIQELSTTCSQKLPKTNIEAKFELLALGRAKRNFWGLNSAKQGRNLAKSRLREKKRRENEEFSERGIRILTTYSQPGGLYENIFVGGRNFELMCVAVADFMRVLGR
ncbi:MAG: hypothetical protein OXI05_13355 [Bacteroidota bacterium]|nr:hypothetical protein [Bacteroidota bacterium]